jgi:Mg/Co/Ni transporter MgtE
MHNDRELVEELRRSLEQEPPTLPQNVLDLREADIADVLNELSLFEAAHTLRHLPLETAIRLCDQPSPHRRGAILEQLEPAQAAGILLGLSSDERARVLREMSPHERRRMLPSLPQEICAEIELLLRYPAKTAGGIMTTEFVNLDPSMTVADALAHIREVAAEMESISGSMLPLILRRLGIDPATSSAPFVATLVDVTGLVIYFTVAFGVMRGTIL